jgi:RNA polymerase sigma-70 factor (ECF subfamily)
LVYIAIDYFIKNYKPNFVVYLDSFVHDLHSVSDYAFDNLSYDEIIRGIQQLSPGYRTVFNLFVIEGLSHEEVATHLGISVGTSKSNLSKARMQLQKILFKQYQIQRAQNAV